jgi:monodictyphenone polyketide synthase
LRNNWLSLTAAKLIIIALQLSNSQLGLCESAMSVSTPSSTSDLGVPDMEFVYFSNEFPKGDLQNIFRQIHKHSKDRRYRTLADFIQEATVVAKEEVQNLPAEARALFPAFDTILSWSESAKLREGLLCGAVDGALLIVAQLAIYIG